MQKERLTTIDRFNKNYPKLLEFISGFSGVMFSFLKTLITSIGLLVVLVLLLVVEVNRLKYGVDYFEVSAAVSLFSAIVLVMLNVLIDFQIHYLETKNNYQKPAKKAFSLRLVFESLKYRLGVGEWEAKPTSPAGIFITIQKLVTVTIVALAFAGSMRSEVLLYNDVAWYDAIGQMANSDLNTILTWIGGLLFTLSAVFSAQIIARYIAMQAGSTEETIVKKSVAITDREVGRVVLNGKQARAQWPSFAKLTNITESDKIETSPKFKFYDSINKKVIERNNLPSLKNKIKKINEERG